LKEIFNFIFALRIVRPNASGLFVQIGNHFFITAAEYSFQVLGVMTGLEGGG